VSSQATDIVRGIDHLIVLVPDLDRSQRLWQALGFATTGRGYHQTGGTANHLLMLDRTYVELLGVVDATADAVYRSWAQSPGLWGIALRGSAEETYGFWRSRGLEATAPASLARGVEIEGRPELARFALTLLPRSQQLPFLVFCCQHLTPQFVWRRDLPTHPNGARALGEVFVLDEDGSARSQFERLTGRSGSPDTLELGECGLTFLSRAGLERRFGQGAAFRKCAAPMLAGFKLLTSDVEAAHRLAERAGLSVRPTPGGGFVTSVLDEGVLIEWAPLH
jgi:catechol 2,3-dioxygenase-like lactoylglutathione lyase family enzyme